MKKEIKDNLRAAVITLLLAIAAILFISLSSCKKVETPATVPTNQVYYLRIESVSSSGEVTYSPITCVKIK